MSTREPVTDPSSCRVCGTSAPVAGVKESAYSGRDFTVRQCPRCWYGWVDDARTDFDALYDDAYYRGRGADPLVDYAAEIDDPRTFRRYEWRGILQIVQALYPVSPDTSWLDLGSGLGGLVRYLRVSGVPKAVGSEDGFAHEQAVRSGIPCLTSAELSQHREAFDVVTSIEVIEHVIDPIPFLAQIHCILKPGGVFFFTTGNARRHRGRLCHWAYVIPDVHVSFFEPSTIGEAFRQVGLTPEHHGFVPGFDDVIKYKTLKNLPDRLARAADRVPGWPLTARLVDRRFGVSAFPVGRKPQVG